MFAALICLLLRISIGSLSHPPQYQAIARVKLQQIYSQVYIPLILSGPMTHLPKDLEELKSYAEEHGHSLDLFSTYDPLTEKEIGIIYYPPSSRSEDSLIFAFEQQIGVFDDVYPDHHDRFPPKYVGYFMRSGIKTLESLPNN